MNYREYRAQRQYEFNSLPVFFAFSEEQFDNGMKKLGIKDITDVRSIGGGGYCHKDTIPKIIEFTNSDSIDELMKDPEFAEDAIYYEMGNHEYHINTYQSNCLKSNYNMHHQFLKFHLFQQQKLIESLSLFIILKNISKIKWI